MYYLNLAMWIKFDIFSFNIVEAILKGLHQKKSHFSTRKLYKKEGSCLKTVLYSSIHLSRVFAADFLFVQNMDVDLNKAGGARPCELHSPRCLHCSHRLQE